LPASKKKAKRRGVGRPRLPETEARKQRVVAHLRREDFATLERWARARGVQVGQLAREILERALRRKK
jgi:hypothetical protein